MSQAIQRLVPGLIETVQGKPIKIQPEETQSGEFADLLSNLVDSVNGAQKEAGEIQTAFLNGDPVELHDMMIKAEEAGLATDLLLEIRNKLLNAYTELMRMPM